MKRIFTVAILSLCCAAVMGADFFDWNTRTDRGGFEAGLFATTPFPITEVSTAYSITNDESPNGKSFNLGTLYFVDGLGGSDANDGLSIGASKKTISSAVSAAGSGNKTIIVRGAYSTFDGIYTNTFALGAIAGTSDTNRWMIVGYGQERPTITGTNSSVSIFARSHASDAFITIQRLKLTGTKANGVRLGYNVVDDKRDGYFSCVDVWFYGCGNDDNTVTDGNCYYLNADYGYLTHCLFERSVGHGVKIGDGSSHNILEWSVSRENGWWPGKTNFVASRTVAIDLPSDVETQTNCVVRYCIGYGSVLYGLQVRRVRGFSIHHNEIYDFGHGVSMDGNMGGVVPYGVVILATSHGSFYGNVVRTPWQANINTILLSVKCSATSGEILVYNNLIYDATDGSKSLSLGVSNAPLTRILGNTIVQSNSTYAIEVRDGQGGGSSNVVANNIVWHSGTGACSELLYHSVEPQHVNNLYYYPFGSGPEWGTDGSGEVVGDPILESFATGSLAPGFWKTDALSPCIGAGFDLSSFFTDDLTGATRVAPWDIGAYEYLGRRATAGTVNVGTLNIVAP